ncbi:MAG: integrase arm-type DNA-binding domain-containing protein [Tateyamaria sp.]|jgi:integrase|nr:integrase arm-type DNA-binding domain-containing protein [Tateyamaria sp.]
MARDVLTATFIKSVPVGKHCDGDGLYFHRRKDGAEYFFLRYTLHGKRKELHLGGYPSLTLVNARILADHHRGVLATGQDPKRQRDLEKQKTKRDDNSLKAITASAMKSKTAELKLDGRDWLSPIKMHILPKLGGMLISDINARDIRDAIEPILYTKAETARKCLNKLQYIFRHAAALDIDIDLQACDKATALLGKSNHVPRHVEAMPHAAVPDFYEKLTEPIQSNLALRFLILVPSARSSPVFHMRWEQIDGDVWTVPADIMKGKKGTTSDYRVPLCAESLAIIELARPFSRGEYVFSNTKGGPMIHSAPTKVMKSHGLTARVHGFRSSMRDWLAECTDCPEATTEAMLSHVTGSKVARAYRRTDDLERRRVYMQRWADFVTGTSAQVINLPTCDTKTAYSRN